MGIDKARIGNLHVWIEENERFFTTISSLRTFLAVAENPGVSSLEIAAICNISPPTVSRIVSAFSQPKEASAIFAIDFSEEDRRINRISLSAAGTEIRSRLLDLINVST